jgi:general L-amino acid transport system substrate-binding protein
MTGITHTAQTYENNDQLQAAFIAGTCDGWTSDKSQLAAQRSAYPAANGGPAALEILEETFSKEPLGPAVLDGDSQWAQIVNWTVLATIAAEELGITQANVGSFGDTTNNAIRRLLGLDITTDAGTAPFNPGLGLPTDFARKVIEAVGNYGEIYDRHVGPSTPLGVPRGLNNLWTNGGLLYSPPYS